MDDVELLTEYARNRSEAAFAELLQRHVDLVYLSALRRLGHHHLAQDVTQMVFIDLARKAAALRHHPSLIAWLYKCTRYSVFNVRRLEARRHGLAQALAQNPLDSPDSPPEWGQIGPILDDAVDELSEKDRAAVLLRYFGKKAYAEVGRALGISEDAARMRVNRATEALRDALQRRGITSTATALSALVTANVVHGAPAGVSAGIAHAVFSLSGAGGTALSALSTMSKIKVGLTSGLILAGTIGVLVENQSRSGLRAEAARLRTQGETLGHVLARNQTIQADLKSLGTKNPEAEELNRIQHRIGVLQARPEGVADSRMKPLANQGRATPDAAYATFISAIEAGDLDAVASLISFRDGPPTEHQRDEFMAKFGETIRARYRTPERLFAAAYLGVQENVPTQPTGATYQVLDNQEIFPGVIQVRLWVRGSGGERELKDSFQKTAEGWSIVLRPLIDRTAAEIRGLLDPATGLSHSRQK